MTPPTPVEERRISAHSSILDARPNSLRFQHSFFCQTSLPYRVTEDQETWSRTAGNIELHVQRGVAPMDGKMGLCHCQADPRQGCYWYTS